MEKYRFLGEIKAGNLQIGDYNTMNTSFHATQVNWEILEEAFHNTRKENNFTDQENELLIQGEKLAGEKDKTRLFSLIRNNLPTFCGEIFSKIAAPGLVELIKVLLQS